MLLRFGVPEAQAEDVAHEVFLIVDRRLCDYDPASPFKAWVYGIARGVAANVRRSDARRQRRLRVVEPPDPPRDPEQALQRGQAMRRVTRFLATLKPAQREVFVLIDVEGLSGPEAAQALGIKLNNVYSRLRLARGRFSQFVRDTNHRTPQGKESA